MTPAPTPQAAPPKKRGGCLRSCLTMLVVLLGLGVFSVGAYKRWLRPYLAERIRTAQAENPLVAWLAEQVGVTNPFEETPTIEKPEGRKAGTSGRASLPPDIALADEPLAEAVNVGPEQLSVFQRLSGAPADVARGHAEQMRRFGWKVKTSTKGDGLQVVSMKPRLGCAADVLPAEGSTELFLRCSGVAPEPDGGVPEPGSDDADGGS